MTRELAEKVIALLAEIARRGLVEVVKDNHAFQTLQRVLETGTTLPNGIEEPAEDTEDCIRTFVDPECWGIVNPEWREFLKERRG